MQIALECIGDNVRYASTLLDRMDGLQWRRAMRIGARPGYPRPYVAQILALDAEGDFVLQYLRGRRDYNRANSVGSRGIYEWHTLGEGRLYYVQELLTWNRRRQYYCTVDSGQLVELTREEVEARCRNTTQA